MIDVSTFKHHNSITELVKLLCNKTQNDDTSFFKVEVAYFLANIASAMGVNIITKDRGEMPVNIYAIALAPSGFGKNHSINILENEIFNGFRKRFIKETMPAISKENLDHLANDRSVLNNTDYDDELKKLESEYERAGAYPFVFDSGSVAALKQLRHKLLLSNCGSINMMVDELGSNLLGSIEMLNAFLELYDQGYIKNKITKNTSENKRDTPIHGKTPANMLLFGTPSKLFDASVTENEFYSFLETGYARRCLFGFGEINKKSLYNLTPEEIYYKQINTTNDTLSDKWHNTFTKLADPLLHKKNIFVSDEVSIELLRYKLICERKAYELPEHAEIQKAELSHRYYKALKLAGAFAFVDLSAEIHQDQLDSAILLVEESGQAFTQMLNREKSYMKLAKYIASVNTDVTHADLHEALPFYKSGISARNELISLACSWGYKQHIIIKKKYIDGIEFFSGETLKQTKLNELIVSYSQDFAHGYKTDKAPFDKLYILAQSPDINFCNHAFENEHRHSDNLIPGFNMLVFDVDAGTSINTALNILSDYSSFIYTTKRHTNDNHRFRILLPINYHIEADYHEYKEIVNNIIDWLPFTIDEASNRASQKWLTNPKCQYIYTDGELFDILPFIPRTSRNETHINEIKTINNLTGLELWFAQRMNKGNRNNTLLKYGLALVDSGLDQSTVIDKIYDFNKQLSSGISEKEIRDTILVTISKKYVK